jgi:Abnormal spindle-like microcephaly-assoc'd, ASPM-SPD-2-Hydin
MMPCPQTSRARRWKPGEVSALLLVLMALLTLAGCQGISAAAKQETQSGNLSINGSTVDFGSVTVGTSKIVTAVVTNNGTASVTVSSAVSSASQFSVNQPTLPTTIAVGQSVTLSVSFTPTAPGSVAGTLTISSDAVDSPVTVSLSGNGVSGSPGTLSPTTSSLGFGNVQVGLSQTLSETVTNSGGSNLTITQATATGAGFSVSGLSLPLTLAPGQNSPSFSVAFAPQSTGAVSGNLAIVSNASNPTLNIALSGTGATVVTPAVLAPTQSSLTFGSVQAGNSKSLSETVTNTGGADATISQDTVTGSGFSLSGFTSPTTLTSGQSLTFSVIFAPQSAASASGNLAITSNASNPTLNISLSGTGTPSGQLGVNSSLNFGSVVVGTSANLPATLSATGASVTISSVNLSSSEFTLSGISFPVTIAAGNSLPFTVTFNPQATGAASGTASFVSNASNSPSLLSLGGSGAAAPVHSVALSWTASSSSNITGYNIYRAPASSGPFSQINASLIAGTAYTDTSVIDGQTYYYVATAVNSDSVESAKSSPPQQAIIPAP